MNARTTLWGLLLAWALTTSAAVAADLTIRIPKLASTEGQVRVGLFNSAADFPKKTLRGELIDAKSSPLAVVFKDVPAGSYAVSAYHDLNGNAKLDTSAIGRPIEPMGFSRNARGLFGPPPFNDAAFSVGAADTAIEIQLK